jgi:hypothetical protein
LHRSCFIAEFLKEGGTFAPGERISRAQCAWSVVSGSIVRAVSEPLRSVQPSSETLVRPSFVNTT